ncbi:hypothetical protein MLD38_002505 [Melastoma candidum]|uniref:Uncharacterized protein n=1 Tax=Melastoma candidum TaxID=119954 RepID=A0ACB9S3A3_9MYRT|nr:hypothetical protein MLD38_002505 [Melastoma candidum]
MASTLLPFAYPPPSSLFLTAFTAASVVAIPFIGLSEVRGVHLQYSKFWNANAAKREARTVPGRTGMVVLYLPALLGGVASLVMFPDAGLRFLVLRLAVTAHFLKRVLEVLFLHKITTRMAADSMVLISFSYFMIATVTIYSLRLSQGLFPEPSIDLMYPGIALFLIGMIGNFYHHLVLSRLRTKGEKEYKIPKGGLFGLVICPHYLFEIIDFIGIAFICQTIYFFAVALNTIAYLAGRSYATRRWYKSKFEDFPEGVKALIPYIF